MRQYYNVIKKDSRHHRLFSQQAFAQNVLNGLILLIAGNNIHHRLILKYDRIQL